MLLIFLKPVFNKKNEIKIITLFIFEIAVNCAIVFESHVNTSSKDYKMVKLISSFALILSILLLIPSELPIFFNMTSILIVLAGAISFAFMGSNNSEKIEFFSKGAVTFGWVGFLIGAILILKNVAEDPAGIGPAAGVALLTVLYGYVIQAICFIIKSSSLIK